MAELLVKQLHRRARELGEDVPVDVSAEPGEAAGEEESGLATGRPAEPPQAAPVAVGSRHCCPEGPTTSQRGPASVRR